MDGAPHLQALEPAPPRRELRDRIDRLTVSADAKALLDELLDIVIHVGGKIIAAGRQIVAF
ncbi:MAG: hypothetical protein ABGW78_13645, partial [Pirellulales bacterium]